MTCFLFCFFANSAARTPFPSRSKTRRRKFQNQSFRKVSCIRPKNASNGSHSWQIHHLQKKNYEIITFINSVYEKWHVCGCVCACAWMCVQVLECVWVCIRRIDYIKKKKREKTKEFAKYGPHICIWYAFFIVLSFICFFWTNKR